MSHPWTRWPSLSQCRLFTSPQDGFTAALRCVTDRPRPSSPAQTSGASTNDSWTAEKLRPSRLRLKSVSSAGPRHTVVTPAAAGLTVPTIVSPSA